MEKEKPPKNKGTVDAFKKIMLTAKRGCKFEGNRSSKGKYNDPDILYWFMTGCGKLMPVRRDSYRAKGGGSGGG